MEHFLSDPYIKVLKNHQIGFYPFKIPQKILRYYQNKDIQLAMTNMGTIWVLATVVNYIVLGKQINYAFYPKIIRLELDTI